VEPRIYRLASSVAVDSIIPPNLGLPFSIETIEDSGTYELHFDLPRLRRDAGENYLASIADIGSSLALAIDSRNLLRVDSPGTNQTPERRLVVYEARSRVREERVEIDVIGPGGTFVVYELGETLTADVTMRRRERVGFPPHWRDPDEIFERVRVELLESRGPTRLRGTFGYLEGSKYEFQEWMEIGFAFMIDSGWEREPRWSYSFIESATAPMEGELTHGG
jgi:hypothetical protein